MAPIPEATFFVTFSIWPLQSSLSSMVTQAERTWRRTRSVSDLNIFKSYRNRVTYLMNQARQAFYTNFLMRIAQTIKDYSELPNNSLLRKRSFRFLMIRTNQN